MRYELRSRSVGVAAHATTVASGSAVADANLDQKLSNPTNWAMQAAEYANHQWSDLKQFDAGYIRTPFPNHECAVSLKDQTFKWKYEPNLVSIIFCDFVSRGLAYDDGESLVKEN